MTADAWRGDHLISTPSTRRLPILTRRRFTATGTNAMSHPTSRSVLAAVLAGTSLVSFTGCTTRTQAFDGYPVDRLWPAMVATAQTPQYPDWKVMENDVFSDESTRTIEIYRLLKRTVVTPQNPPRTEDRTWKFRIELKDSDGAPALNFSARQLAVPDHVWREAERYFAQVRTALGGAAPSSTASVDAPSPR
jgi:hypothetical protein